jgi:hypothetical protein
MRFAVIAVLASALIPGAFAQRAGAGGNGAHAGGAAPRAGYRGVRPPPYAGGRYILPYSGGYVDPFYAGETDPGYYEAQPPAPLVIVNPYYQPEIVRPQIKDYSNVSLPEPGVTIVGPGTAPAPPAAAQTRPADDNQPNMFLIALKDGSVLTSVAYWVQDATLNYITMAGAHNHVSVSMVDRDLSIRLNAERQVQFRLAIPH